MSSQFDLNTYLEDRGTRVQRILEDLLPEETVPPERLHQAMRYSVFAGGKRLRPVLVIASAEAIAGKEAIQESRAVQEAAAAVEFLHTYSLVHDDLPAMDDDDWRRGKLTCHKAFDEATAVLVGDALQALAFQTLAELPAVSAVERVECVCLLGRAVGSQGMVGGQMEDLICEGLPKPKAEQVVYIHRHKTGALIEACCRIGGCLGGGSQEQVELLGHYGAALGLAFQVIDDILDVVGDQESLGKSIGKDQSSCKATFPAVFGLETARKKADEFILQAKTSLKSFGEQAVPLEALADFVAARNY